MRKSIKRTIGLLLALVMVVGLALPASIGAEAEKFSQTLRVHKVLQEGTATQDFGADFYKNQDGTIDLTKAAPKGTKLIEGVKFILVKGDQHDKKIKDIAAGDIVAQGLTGTEGYVDLKLDNLDAGQYTLLEDHAGSTYKGTKGETLTAMGAVPQVFTLPLRDENCVADQVNLFPKNLQDIFGNGGEKTTPEKNVGYAIGEEFPYTITLPVPANSHLSIVKLRDKMSSQLSFSKVLSLKYGATELTASDDYTIELNKEDGGETYNFIITLTEKGLEKINEKATKENLVLTYNVYFNSTAVPNKVAENEYKYTAGNNPDHPHEDGGNSTTNPKTYGANFIKTKNDKTTGLAGAEFYINDGTGKYLKQDAEKKVSWVDDKTDASKYISGADGKFEVVGIPQGTYFLEEFKAPNGYAILKDPVKFTVTETSYDATKAVYAATVPNDPVSLPQTGGIGSVIFVLVGMGMVGAGVYVMRRRKDS